MHRNSFVVLLIMAVFFGSLYTIFFKGTEFVMPFQQDQKNSKIKLGLDLRGGIHLEYTLDESKLTPGTNTSEAIDKAIDILRNRVDGLGIAEPYIQREGEKSIVVELPGAKDPEEAKQILGKTAQLQFKLVVEDKKLKEQAFEGNIPADCEMLEMKHDGSQLLLKKEALLTGDSLNNARAESGLGALGNEVHVSIDFNKEGASTFGKITGDNIGKKIAIVLDDKVYSAPVVKDRIPNGKAVISGNFGIKEANDLAIVLRSGSLPAPLIQIHENIVGPTLGQDSIKSGMLAGLIGILAIMLLMAVYYKKSGLIADVGLLCNLLYLVGAMAMLGATFTMPGLAGVILTMGMSVDSNVLIFERVREELRAGKTVMTAVDQGYKKAFWTIFDSHVTTLITAAILFVFGTGPVKGFAVTLSLGVIISLFTALIVTKVIFDWRLSRGETESLSI